MNLQEYHSVITSGKETDRLALLAVNDQTSGNPPGARSSWKWNSLFTKMGRSKVTWSPQHQRVVIPRCRKCNTSAMDLMRKSKPNHHGNPEDQSLLNSQILSPVSTSNVKRGIYKNQPSYEIFINFTKIALFHSKICLLSCSQFTLLNDCRQKNSPDEATILIKEIHPTHISSQLFMGYSAISLL